MGEEDGGPGPPVLAEEEGRIGVVVSKGCVGL